MRHRFTLVEHARLGQHQCLGTDRRQQHARCVPVAQVASGGIRRDRNVHVADDDGIGKVLGLAKVIERGVRTHGNIAGTVERAAVRRDDADIQPLAVKRPLTSSG